MTNPLLLLQRFICMLTYYWGTLCMLIGCLHIRWRHNLSRITSLLRLDNDGRHHSNSLLHTNQTF